jgi:hypothetical protein
MALLLDKLRWNAAVHFASLAVWMEEQFATNQLQETYNALAEKSVNSL